jgi:hypothetical protein
MARNSHTGESPIQSSTDIYAVCDLVKLWFRVLPEPLFPPRNYRELIAAISRALFDLTRFPATEMKLQR